MKTGKSTSKTYLQTLGVILLAAAVLALAGCTSPYGTRNGGGGNGYGTRPVNNGTRRANCTDCGTVQSVQQVYVDKNSSTLGTVVGALVGGVLGNQVGGGKGRTAATVAGAAAGGYAGHEVGKSRGKQVPAWQIVVREDNGQTVTVTQKEDPRVRSGDYVQVRNGHVYLL